MSRRAFTLVEVTIVVALIGIMAAVALPRYAALQAGQSSRDFTSALLRLGADARLIAIENNQTVQVTYDDDRRMIVFSVLDTTTLAPTEEKTIALPDSVELPAFTLDGQFSSNTDWTMEFYPDGSGLDAGIEVEDGAHTFHLNFDGRDGTATQAAGRLEESDDQEWQAGEIEQRV